MSVALIDTNCFVAWIRDEHSQHAAARTAIDDLIDRRTVLHIASHSLAEAYSVITRSPEPIRLDPRTAFETIERNLENISPVALTEKESFDTIRRLASRDLGGGIVYDALILAVARKAKAEIIVTFNDRDFLRLDPAPIRIVNPAA